MINNISSPKSDTIVSVLYKSKFAFTTTELIFYIALIFNFAYVMFYPVYSALHSCFHYVIAAFIVLLLFSGKRVRYRETEAFELLAFLAMSVAAILMNHSGLGVLILILWPLTIIYLFRNSSFADNYINRIHALMLLGWALAVIVSFGYTAAYFENFEREIAKGGINPNTLAIVIASTCLFLGLYIDNASKSKWLKLLIYLISFASLYRTRARTSLVALFAIILLELFLKDKLKKSKRMAMALMAAMVVAGIIFPFVYVGLYRSGIIAYKTVFLGKRIFTGRQYIWWNLWNYLQANQLAYIWGVGYNTELYARGTFNLHNAYLMIFAQYGIPIFAIYLAYLFHSVSSMFGQWNQITDLQFKCYQIVLFALIVGFGETILSYLPNMIFFAMAIGIGCRERVGADSHDS